MSDKKIFTFQGRELSISWDERLCIHAAECGASQFTRRNSGILIFSGCLRRSERNNRAFG